jgi:hypothetical protein
MPSLEELLQSGLGGIIQNQGAPLEEDLYQRQAQAERESTFGRGLGISSVTRDALAKARMDAALAAQQAQLAALGQAAGITQGAANRAQQESQFSRNLKQQKDMANTQMIAQGVGAGAGALAQLGGAAFGPEIRGGLRGMFGLGPLRQDGPASPGGGREVMAPPSAVPNVMGSFTEPTGQQGDLGAFPDFQMPTSFSPSDFSGFDASFGGLDLSSLYDASFNPYQQDSWGWY